MHDITSEKVFPKIPAKIKKSPLTNGLSFDIITKLISAVPESP